MGKGAYIGVGGVARKIKKGYVGVNGVARKIKKAYIGIGGVARPCYSLSELVYYGTIDGYHKSGSAATSVGNYALFGGGYSITITRPVNSYGSDRVIAYDTSLVRSTPTELSVGRGSLAATTIRNYALFGGGDRATESSTNSIAATTVDAYDTSLIRSTPTVLSKARMILTATTVGNYALFGGGCDSNGNVIATVDAYDTSLVRSTPTALSKARKSLAATTVGNYALFGGGSDSDGTGVATVDAYNTSLVRSTPAELSKGRYGLAATSVGNYALFGGGGSYSPIVDAYDTSLVRSTPTELIKGRSYPAATSVGNYAIFAGGDDTGFMVDGRVDRRVDAYDECLLRSNPAELSTLRDSVAATTLGNYALFCGDNNHFVTDVFKYLGEDY